PGVPVWSTPRAYIFWESSDVYIFPQAGGDCAQVARRGCVRPDVGPPGFTGGARDYRKGEPALHAVSGYGRSRGGHECREGTAQRLERRSQRVPPLPRISGRSSGRELPYAVCPPAG